MFGKLDLNFCVLIYLTKNVQTKNIINNLAQKERV